MDSVPESAAALPIVRLSQINRAAHTLDDIDALTINLASPTDLILIISLLLASASGLERSDVLASL